MELFTKSKLSPEVRAQVHGLVTPWRDNPDIMTGVYNWAGDLKSAEVMPKGGRKIWNQLKLAWFAGGFLLKGFEPNRLLNIYRVVRDDKNELVKRQ